MTTSHHGPIVQGGPPPPTATRQFGALVLVPIVPDRRAALGELLAAIDAETIASMQGRPPQHAIIPFHRLRSVHYARFVVIEAVQGERALLSFSTDYDGPEGDAGCSEAKAWQHHVDDLMAHAAAGLTRVLSCCEGFRPGTLAAYLGRHRRAASTFYVGSSGRSLGQIRWEAALRQRVEGILAANDRRFEAPEAVRERVLAALAALGVVVPKFPAQPELESRVTVYLWLALGAVLGALGLLVFASVALLGVPLGGAVSAIGLGALIVALVLVVRFRWLERTDQQFQPEYSGRTHGHFQSAAAGENQFLQNPLTHLVAIKPGPLRWLLIRAVFAALQVLARYRYNKGRLGDIPSIHFARWVIIPGRRVLFLSDFDSSWQSYPSTPGAACRSTAPSAASIERAARSTRRCRRPGTGATRRRRSSLADAPQLGIRNTTQRRTG